MKILIGILLSFNIMANETKTIKKVVVESKYLTLNKTKKNKLVSDNSIQPINIYQTSVTKSQDGTMHQQCIEVENHEHKRVEK